MILRTTRIATALGSISTPWISIPARPAGDRQGAEHVREGLDADVIRFCALSRDAYQQAGINNPRSQISMAEVHDCFTPTELVLYEDLGFSERGIAWKEVMDGYFDLEGKLPVNPDGGLKSFTRCGSSSAAKPDLAS